MKVYLFILKSTNEMYAYTSCKEYADSFISQRNKDLFVIKKVNLKKYEYMLFTNKNSSKKIIKDYLFDGNDNIEIFSTVNESNSLSESCEYIVTTVSVLEEEFADVGLKKKYLNVITNITDEITGRTDKKNSHINVDTFRLFYYLFRDTFEEVSDDYKKYKLM